MFSLSTATLVAYVLSVGLPLLSSLLSRQHWPSELTGILTLLLSGLTGFGTEWAHAGSGFRWQAAASVALTSFVIAILSRYGIWRDTHLDAKLLLAGSPKDWNEKYPPIPNPPVDAPHPRPTPTG